MKRWETPPGSLPLLAVTVVRLCQHKRALPDLHVTIAAFVCFFSCKQHITRIGVENRCLNGLN